MDPCADLEEVAVELGLEGLCKILKLLLWGQAQQANIQATKMHDFTAMLAGVALTIIVRASYATTSSLPPRCGVEGRSLAKTLPLIYIASIGMTATA